MPHLFPDDKSFRALFSGKCGSGKTTLLCKFLTGELRGRFDQIIIMSPTINDDPCWKKYLKTDDKMLKCHDKFDLDKLDEIFKNLKTERTDKNGKKQDMETLLILDDCIQESNWISSHGSQINPLGKCFIRGRHKNLSIILLSQNVRSAPPGIRSQLEFILIAKSGHLKEIRTLHEEFGGKIEKFSDFHKMMEEKTEEPYSFMIINIPKSTFQKLKPTD